MQKQIIIIAGPNGAGKTTFARAFLPQEAHCPHFVNADLIAAGLAPFAPETAALRAGRLMLQEIHQHVQHGHNFALETTLAGLGYSGQSRYASSRRGFTLFQGHVPCLPLSPGPSPAWGEGSQSPSPLAGEGLG